AGNEPVAFVVAAKELALFRALSDEEQQVAVSGLHVDDGDLCVGPWLAKDLEELALAVSLDIERERAGHAGTTNRTVGNLEPSANASKLEVEKIRVHAEEDKFAANRVRIWQSLDDGRLRTTTCVRSEAERPRTKKPGQASPVSDSLSAGEMYRLPYRFGQRFVQDSRRCNILEFKAL